MVRYRISIPSGITYQQTEEDMQHTAVLCQLIEKRLYEKLAMSRNRILNIISPTISSETIPDSSSFIRTEGDIFPELPCVDSSVLLGHLLCFLSHYEVVAILPAVSCPMASLAACDISSILLTRRLKIRNTVNQIPLRKDSARTEKESLELKRNDQSRWEKCYALDEAALNNDNKIGNGSSCSSTSSSSTSNSSKSSSSSNSSSNSSNSSNRSNLNFGTFAEVVPLECLPSLIHGTGTFATRDIKQGEPIALVTGEIASEGEHSEGEHEHGFQLMGGRILTPIDIDGTDNRNAVHYCNHSCVPNASLDRLDIDHKATGCDLAFKRPKCTIDGLIPWMSKHKSLRTVWRSFCVPLLQYKARPHPDSEKSDVPLHLRRTPRPHPAQLYVLMARNKDIKKGDEVTITYTSNGHSNNNALMTSACGRVSSKFDAIVCGCTHNGSHKQHFIHNGSHKQHFMSGRYLNENNIDFGQRCFAMRYRYALKKGNEFPVMRMEVLHRDFGGMTGEKYTWDREKAEKEVKEEGKDKEDEDEEQDC